MPLRYRTGFWLARGLLHGKPAMGETRALAPGAGDKAWAPAIASADIVSNLSEASNDGQTDPRKQAL